MAHFPGIAMVIDDQFNLVYEEDSEKTEILIQQKPLKQLKLFFEDHCIPFVPITNTESGYVLNKVKNHDNVRLLVLDLDLNNDGEVDEEEDIPLILNIIQEALNRYGYFFLLINSAHAEKWTEDIAPKLLGELSVFSKAKSAFKLFDKKSDSLVDIIIELQNNNFSLELVYDFECTLNRARDNAFAGLIDFEKRTWNRIYLQILKETSNQSSFLLSTAYLTIIKQYFLSVRYSIPVIGDPIDNDIAIKAFNQINYISNYNNNLNDQPIWTGNLYYIENPAYENLKYALIVTPECDLAQTKFINYQIIYGYEVNDATFPEDYNHVNYDSTEPPIHALKSGKKKDKWRSKDNLKDTGGFIEHLYVLPFASKSGKTIILDFRDLTFIYPSIIVNWELIKRINDPMITDILDKISLLFNRKGLLPLLPNSIKVI